MTREEIKSGVQEVLARLGDMDPEHVRESDPLKYYLPPVAGLALAKRIDDRFPPVNLTDLTNKLYDSVETVGDLIDYVKKSYP